MYCNSCHAEIVWCETTTGKRMPMDAAPSEKGTFVILGGRAHTATDEDRRLNRPLHTSHFSSCPQASDWRRAR
jgi:hypothetical protein